MRGGRRLDDAATSRAMLGQRATRARDTARFTALEDMIRELAPFPPSYDVSAGQDTGFAEWRYTDLLGGIYLSTQSTEINCRIMALAAVNRVLDRVALRLEKFAHDQSVGFFIFYNQYPGHRASLVKQTN